jgi:hypothetical protein
MLKIGNTHVAAVVARGVITLRAMTTKYASLQSENTQLREKIASMEREQEIAVLAKEMDEKGLNADLTFEEKVAHIRQHTDLSRVREAVKMASSGSVRIADVTTEPSRGLRDSLTSFCLGGE